jgi:phospholipid/cholesterol/gamma-HCH transport system substrate-binding protein
MKFKMRFAEQIVGLFVLLAIAFLTFTIFLLASNQRWFVRDYTFYSSFPTARGLSRGMAINFKGFKIGQVDQIILTTDNQVDIRMTVFKQYYEKITQNSIIELSSNILGGSELLLHPGISSEPLPLADGSTIPALGTKEAAILINDRKVILSREADPITGLLGQIDPILASVDTVLQTLDRTLTATNNVIAGQNAGPVGDILANLAGISDTLNQDVGGLSGQVGSVLSNTDLIAANLVKTSEGLTETEGLVLKLLDPQGSFATLFDDNNEIYDMLVALLADVQTSVDDINVLTSFLVDTRPQLTGLLEETQAALDQGQDVLEGLSNNPLIRGGIPEEVAQPTTFQSIRDEEF